MDKIHLSSPRVLRAAAEGLYAGISLPLIGSAVAAATSTPLQLATCLVGGVALGWLALTATNIAFPVLMYRALDGNKPG